MRRSVRIPRLAAVVVTALVSVGVVAARDPELTAEMVIAKHLDAIGTAGVRATARSRAAEGKVTFIDRIAGGVPLEGTAVMLSQGPKFKAAFRFAVVQYPGEQIVFNGQETQIAMVAPGKRSLLGDFLSREPEIMQDGLFGGSASTAWVLLDRKTRGGKIRYEGLKKVDGRDLHDLTYEPKHSSRSGELVIHLYLDPETFRHVMTVYRLRLRVTGGDMRQGTDEIVETLEERFSDFRTAEGVTLPAAWEIRCRREPGAPSELQWQVVFSKVAGNTLN